MADKRNNQVEIHDDVKKVMMDAAADALKIDAQLENAAEKAFPDYAAAKKAAAKNPNSQEGKIINSKGKVEVTDAMRETVKAALGHDKSTARLEHKDANHGENFVHNTHSVPKPSGTRTV